MLCIEVEMEQLKLFYTDVKYGGVTQHYYFGGSWIDFGVIQYTANFEKGKAYTISKTSIEKIIEFETKNSLLK